MSRTASREELLRVCVQDLHAARRAVAARMPAVSRHAGAALAGQLAQLARDCAREAERFEAGELSLHGPENIWMAGILDDAERDIRSIEPGALLDVALVGALRKGIMADAVSLETALALARALGREDLAATLADMRARARLADAAFSDLLEQLA